MNIIVRETREDEWGPLIKVGQGGRRMEWIRLFSGQESRVG